MVSNPILSRSPFITEIGRLQNTGPLEAISTAHVVLK